MDKFFHKAEPILMDEELLRTVVVEQSTKDQLGRVSKVDDMTFDEVLQLKLSYKNLLNIDNLWEFTSLTKIELNNNCIKKIEGLDHLIHLQWLNLSFNCIEKIDGLNSLRKLEFLNLTANKIKVIENMDSLEKLTLLSIAFNCIDKFEIVLYLRKLKNLKTLNIHGNPFPTTENYKLYIAAHFPNLMYLDYRTLSEKTKNEAFLKYQVAIEKLKSKEELEEAEHRQEADLQLHRDAFVEYLNGSYLYKDMLKDDQEADKIYALPGVAALHDTYPFLLVFFASILCFLTWLLVDFLDPAFTFETKIVDFCNQMFHLGLAEHRKREREFNLFLRGQTEAEKHYQERASEMLAEFEHRHQEMVVELQQTDDAGTLKTKFDQYDEEIDALQKQLMALEFQMVTQLEEIIEKFDINMSEMVSHFRDMMQSIYPFCRDLEDNYYKQVVVVAVAAVDAAASDGLDDVLDDMRESLLDKEVLTDALANSHDNHLFKINDRETELVNRLNAWRAGLMKKIQDDILKWDSIRISDIERYVDYLKKQLEALL
ncbi:LOW QUALITY PROTEIN: dynein regulatory complex subunit 3-like [Neosynchiropus ocellatus]